MDDRKDAARYRWLRNQALSVLVSGPVCIMADEWGKPLTTPFSKLNPEFGPEMPYTIDGKELDAAIDDAITRAALSKAEG